MRESAREKSRELPSCCRAGAEVVVVVVVVAEGRGRKEG